MDLSDDLQLRFAPHLAKVHHDLYGRRLKMRWAWYEDACSDVNVNKHDTYFDTNGIYFAGSMQLKVSMILLGQYPWLQKNIPRDVCPCDTLILSQQSNRLVHVLEPFDGHGPMAKALFNGVHDVARLCSDNEGPKSNPRDWNNENLNGVWFAICALDKLRNGLTKNGRTISNTRWLATCYERRLAQALRFFHVDGSCVPYNGRCTYRGGETPCLFHVNESGCIDVRELPAFMNGELTKVSKRYKNKKAPERGREKYDYDHTGLIPYCMDLGVHTIVGLLVIASIEERWGEARKELNYRSQSDRADSSRAVGSPRVSRCLGGLFRAVAEGDRTKIRHSCGFCCFKRDESISDTDYANMAPLFLAMIKVAGHIGDQMAMMFRERYAYPLPKVLVPSIYVEAHHGTSPLNLSTLLVSEIGSGLNCRSRSCVGFNPHPGLHSYGRMFHAQGLVFITVDLVTLHRHLFKTTKLTYSWEESTVVWETCVSSIVWFTTHKSLGVSCHVPTIAISRIVIDSAQVHNERFVPRPIIGFNRGWNDHIVGVRGHLAFASDDSGLTKLLVDLIEAFMKSACGSLGDQGDQERKGNRKAKVQKCAQTMRDAWLSSDSVDIRTNVANYDRPRKGWFLAYCYCTRCGSTMQLWPWCWQRGVIFCFSADGIDITPMLNVQGVGGSLGTSGDRFVLSQ